MHGAGLLQKQNQLGSLGCKKDLEMNPFCLNYTFRLQSCNPLSSMGALPFTSMHVNSEQNLDPFMTENL